MRRPSDHPGRGDRNRSISPIDLAFRNLLMDIRQLSEGARKVHGFYFAIQRKQKSMYDKPDERLRESPAGAEPEGTGSHTGGGRRSSTPTARSASARYAAGHIPTAIHLDLWGVSLIDTDPAPLKAFMWMIEHVLAVHGVDATTPVVV
jgi:hypothetical protein